MRIFGGRQVRDAKKLDINHHYCKDQLVLRSTTCLLEEKNAEWTKWGFLCNFARVAWRCMRRLKVKKFPIMSEHVPGPQPSNRLHRLWSYFTTQYMPPHTMLENFATRNYFLNVISFTTGWVAYGFCKELINPGRFFSVECLHGKVLQFEMDVFFSPIWRRRRANMRRPFRFSSFFSTADTVRE